MTRPPLPMVPQLQTQLPPTNHVNACLCGETSLWTLGVRLVNGVSLRLGGAPPVNGGTYFRHFGRSARGALSISLSSPTNIPPEARDFEDPAVNSWESVLYCASEPSDYMT